MPAAAGLRSDTRDRILAGAFAAASEHGLARLSLDLVSRYAGVSRQTLYRYFGNRDGLISALILREERAMLETVARATATHADLRPALEAGISAALHAVRSHPLLDRLLATEPDTLLPFLTTGRGPVLSAARPALEALVAERVPHLSPATVERLADMVSRLLISYAINPPDDDIEHVAASLADLILHGVKNT